MVSRVSRVSVRSWDGRFPDQRFDESLLAASRNRLRYHRNVDPETVLPRTGLISGIPEKPSAYFTTARTYVVLTTLYIYIYI